MEGDQFRLHFSTETGLITAGYVQKELVLTGGPYLHLTGLALAPWKADSFRWEGKTDCAAVFLSGSYGKVRVRFEIRIDRTGFMETLYEVSDMPYASPRRLAMRVGDDTDSGGYEEVGIRFLVPGEMDTLSWKRRGCGILTRTGTSDGCRAVRQSMGPKAVPARTLLPTGTGSWKKGIRFFLAPLIQDGGVPVILRH